MKLCLISLVLVSAPVFAQTTTINDSNPAILYSLNANIYSPTSNWTSNGGHTSNYTRSGPSTFQGSSVSVSFDGSGITWLGRKGPNYGFAAVSIDGGNPVTVDSYNSTPISSSNYSNEYLAFGPHVLTIRLLANKNSASNNYYQTVEGFTITGTALPLYSGTVTGYHSSNLVFSPSVGYWPANGVWECYGYLASDLSGGHCWSGASNSTVSLSFTGSLIEVIGRPDAENGYMKVSIDGGASSTVDMNWGTVDDDSLNGVVVYAAKVSQGTHTIKLDLTGSHDSHASGNLAQIDEFISFGGGTVTASCAYATAEESGPTVTLTEDDKSGLFWDASTPDLETQPTKIIQAQNFTWTAIPNTLGWHVCSQGGPCMSDSNGTIVMSAISDIFQIESNSSVLDVTTCKFLEAPTNSGGAVNTGYTQSPWTFSSQLH